MLTVIEKVGLEASFERLFWGWIWGVIAKQYGRPIVTVGTCGVVRSYVKVRKVIKLSFGVVSALVY